MATKPLPDQDEERIDFLSRMCNPLQGDAVAGERGMLVATKLQSAYTHRDSAEDERQPMPARTDGMIAIIGNSIPMSEAQWEIVCDYATRGARTQIKAGVLARRTALIAAQMGLIPLTSEAVADFIGQLWDAFDSKVPDLLGPEDRDAFHSVVGELSYQDGYRVDEMVFNHMSYFWDLATGVTTRTVDIYEEPLVPPSAEVKEKSDA